MFRLKMILTFALIAHTAMGQVKDYKGSIVDMFDNPLSYVTITNLRTQKTAVSNCKGMFRIRANKGDSLSFTKAYYLFHRTKIVGSRQMDILLNYDATFIKNEIKDRRVTLHDHETPMKESMCQPLFLVDGNPYTGPHRMMLEVEDVMQINVLKGSDATDMFGHHGRDSVIFILTTCEYQKKQRRKD